ncbi:proteasome subunit alpha [Nitrospira defluvii]|nr:proteasome subunit alpha [Nitrospira defluvii]
MMLDGDFLALLKKDGYTLGSSLPGRNKPNMSAMDYVSSATTILAFKYREGLLVAGDRRATAGTTVMHDRADKVIDIDRYAVMAIAGVPATAFEIARVLEHSFKYYRRSQLQDLSLEGKVRALSRLLKENVPMAIQGIGAVAPIFAAYDLESKEGRIYFYDILGAEFEVVEFATAGSGSPGIRGALHFNNKWSDNTLTDCEEEDAVILALRLLETAAEFDVATGGVKEAANIFPIVKTITKNGVQQIPLDRLNTLYRAKVVSPHV